MTVQVRCSHSSGGSVKVDGGDDDEGGAYLEGTRRVMAVLASVDIVMMSVCMDVPCFLFLFFFFFLQF